MAPFVMKMLHKSTKSQGSRTSSGAKKGSPIDITIDQHFESKVYTSGSVVSGQVTLTPQTDVSFQKFEVALIGGTMTHTRLVQQDVPASSHTFLRLDMPVSEGALPASRVLEARGIYSVPFSFVIPHQLTPEACKDRDEIVHEQHIQPPPTIGSWESNDLTDKSIQITYAVKARLVVGREKNGKDKFNERSHQIRVIPSIQEQPPLNMDFEVPMYRMSQEKLIKKHMGAPKLGHLMVSAAQPSPVVLSVNKLQTSPSSVLIDLDFVSTSSTATPPDVYAKSASIEAITTYSLGHISYLPDQQKRPAKLASTVTPYSTSLDISLEKPGKIVWERISWPEQKETSRRTSEATTHSQGRTDSLHSLPSTQSSESHDMAGPGSVRYRARLSVPFELPDNRKQLFLPTFHTCLVSRTYTLHLTMAAKSYGTTFGLTMPVQVSTGGFDAELDNGLPGYTQIEGEPTLEGQLPTYEDARW